MMLEYKFLYDLNGSEIRESEKDQKIKHCHEVVDYLLDAAGCS